MQTYRLGGHFRRYPPPAELIDWNYWLAFNTLDFYVEGLDETTNNHVRPDSNNYDVVWIGTVYYWDLHAFPTTASGDPIYPTQFADACATIIADSVGQPRTTYELYVKIP